MCLSLLAPLSSIGVVDASATSLSGLLTFKPTAGVVDMCLPSMTAPAAAVVAESHTFGHFETPPIGVSDGHFDCCMCVCLLLQYLL